ncbi:hypothetical protein HpKG61_16100 [Helicobacter pylori]
MLKYSWRVREMVGQGERMKRSKNSLVCVCHAYHRVCICN